MQGHWLENATQHHHLAVKLIQVNTAFHASQAFLQQPASNFVVRQPRHQCARVNESMEWRVVVRCPVQKPLHATQVPQPLT